MADEPSAAPAPSPTAGSLLRRARESQGLHIAVLAASLKVPQRKLEALERDRLDELPDATFARALAQTVCRALKIDAAPVLALLPRAGTGTAGLDQVSAGLNTPFRDKPAHVEIGGSSLLRHPATVIVAVLLVAAAAVWFWPRGAPPATSLPVALEPASEPAAGVADPAASEPSNSSATLPADDAASAAPGEIATTAMSATAPIVETVHDAPPSDVPADASAAPAATPGNANGLLVLRADQASWVEVADGQGRTLLSRTVMPGERVGLDGTPPLRLTVGNAGATEVRFRGSVVDLAAATRDNVARLELK